MTPAATNPGPAARYWTDDKHGPLPALLLILTMVTGVVDAVSYLKLGHVFVANMTGNVVFLGFAVAGATELSVPASLVAIAAFLGGALAGGRIATTLSHHRGRLLAVGIYLQAALVGVALVVAVATFAPEAGGARYALIVLLALAMGLQNAVVRRLGVPDLTTTVLTLTLTGIAADSTWVGGRNPNPGRRLIATVTMFLGAAIGALLVLRAGVAPALALAMALLVLNAILAYRHSSSAATWTAGS
jgi:uncharacterized membrane protein YoaK (UPF0700 family)